MTPRALQAQEPLQAEADVLPHQSAGPEEFQNGADADGGFCFPRQSGRRPAPTLTTALPAAASPSSRSSWRPCTRPDRTQPAPGFTIGFDGERDRPPLAAPRVSGDQQALGRPLHERHCSGADGSSRDRSFSGLCLLGNGVAASARMGRSALRWTSAAPPDQLRLSPKPGPVGRRVRSRICSRHVRAGRFLAGSIVSLSEAIAGRRRRRVPRSGEPWRLAPLFLTLKCRNAEMQ